MTQEEYLERVSKALGIKVLSEDQATALVEIYDDVRAAGWESGHQQGYESGYFNGSHNADSYLDL